MNTSIMRPYRSDAIYFNNALNNAGLLNISSSWQAKSIDAAPAKNDSISNPTKAAVTKPTSVNTENRPPTP